MPARSSGDVRTAIAAMLADDLPRRIQRVRDVKGLDERECPSVQQIHNGQTPDEAFEAGATENRVWVVVTNPRHMPPMQMVDWQGGQPVYEIKYTCQIEIWAMGTDWDNALQVRDEAESAIRFALIENANLSTDHTRETGYALHPPTVMSQFGVPMRAPTMTGSDWTWVPALVTFDLRVEDVIADSTPTDPPTPFQGVGLFFVKMPVGETLADPDTEQGKQQIEEWQYGEAQQVEHFER